MPSGKDRSRLHPAAIAERWRNPPPVVPVLRLYGTIGRGGSLRSGMTLAGMAGAIQKAFSTKRAVAVALSINSPGGSPTQSSLIGSRIRRLADEKGVPVVAFVEDLAASGGYWLAAAADEIVVDANSIVGSIGVISASFGVHDAIGRIGVERRVYTAGRSKSFLDPFQPEKEEDVARLRAIQDEVHGNFIDHVKARRGGRIAEGADLFTGDVWVGRQAIDIGLADKVGHLVPEMKARHGDKVRFAVYGPKRGLLRRLGMDALLSVPDALEERALWARYGL